MLRNELRVNYGKLETLTAELEKYLGALEQMGSSMSSVMTLLGDGSGQAYEHLQERYEEICGQIDSCKEEVADLYDLFTQYSSDMLNYIRPIYKYQDVLVDRWDIRMNLSDIYQECLRLLYLGNGIEKPFVFGFPYKAFASEEERACEEENFRIVEGVMEMMRDTYYQSFVPCMERMDELYQKKVAMYEKTDDEWSCKVLEYYWKYTDVWEFLIDGEEMNMEGVRNFIVGFGTAVFDLLVGMITLAAGVVGFAGSGVVYLGSIVLSVEAPEWAAENVEGTCKKLKEVCEDPWIIMESLEQSVSDAWEQKGISYCAGYVVGTIAGSKGLDKAVKAVSGAVKGSKGGTSSTNQYCLSGEEHFEAYKQMFGAENVEWTSRDTLSSADRLRIQNWEYPPTDELYLKYKDVYQNDLYFNQATGDINWPVDNGFAEYPDSIILSPGTIIDRYGSDYGTFTSPVGIPYENRALAPGTEMKPYSIFEVVKPLEVQAGKIAPWFNQPGGGLQYVLPDIVDELIDAGVLRRLQ